MDKKMSPDRRIQRTRQVLLNSMIELISEKGYATLTVQDIIDRANVGRSTFYSHFQDKEALLLSGAEYLYDLLDRLNAHTRPEQAGGDFSLAVFQHAEAYRKSFKALLGKQAGNVVLPNFEKTLTIILKEHYQMVFSEKKMPVPLDIFVQYLVNTFLRLLTWWLDNDFSCPAEQVNDYYRKLTQPTVQMLLKGA